MQILVMPERCNYNTVAYKRNLHGIQTCFIFLLTSRQNLIKNEPYFKIMWLFCDFTFFFYVTILNLLWRNEAITLLKSKIINMRGSDLHIHSPYTLNLIQQIFYLISMIITRCSNDRVAKHPLSYYIVTSSGFFFFFFFLIRIKS
jgi:hypothetical protein